MWFKPKNQFVIIIIFSAIIIVIVNIIILLNFVKSKQTQCNISKKQLSVSCKNDS